MTEHTHTAFTWTMAKDGESIRFVLVGSVVITIETPWDRTSSWTRDTDEEAREAALTQTWIREKRGFTLQDDVRAVKVDVHLRGLTAEVMVIEQVGPILWTIMETLRRHGVVLDG